MIRGKPANLVKRFLMFAPGDLGISSVTAAELYVGARKSVDPKANLGALSKLLLPLEVAAFDLAAARHYGDIRYELERVGTPIGALDSLIAAHAMSLGITLVTNHLGEFSRIPGLGLEDWT